MAATYAEPMSVPRTDPTQYDAITNVDRECAWPHVRCEASVAECIEARHGVTMARLIWQRLKVMAR